MAALAGVGVVAAAGGLAGALIGMGMPELEAKRYEGELQDGNILISVHADNSDQRKLADDIFKRDGADEISSTGEASVPREQRA